MCGIAGILTEAGRDGSSRRLTAMTRALFHRGPDDEGFFADGPVALGFRRLSVIDLETGQQPIVLEDGSAAIVLNGEIYNFRELRAELEARGHRFRTRGDVEVALRLYAEQGAAAFSQLNGMFALALWDARRRVLLLVRDRFGIKPLYVCREGDTIGFASELRALAAGGFPTTRSVDPIELRHYLAWGHLSSAGSPWTSVRTVPPGAVVEYGADGTLREWSFWKAPDPEDVELPSDDPALAVNEALRAAVRRQLVADVPVGVFLSGGLDSSCVAAAAREAVSGPLRTFSVGFEGPDAVSELPAAREVASALGSEHHELTVDPAQVRSDLDRILDDLDAPLADPTAIPTWYMSQLARSRVVVALSGEGADELFGGYARQRYDVALDRLGALGRRVVPVAFALAGRRLSPRLRRRVRMRPSLARQLDWGRFFMPGEIDRLAPAATASEEDLVLSYRELGERWQRMARLDPLNGRLEADREIFLPGDLLPKVDRMSMAHSLEVRVPFLDHDLVDLVLPMPGTTKLSIFRDKRLLRQAARGLAPEAAVTRRKQGFEVPIGGWLRGALREPMLDLLSPAALSIDGLLETGAVAELVRQHLDGVQDRGRELWALMVLSAWRRGTAGRGGAPA